MIKQDSLLPALLGMAAAFSNPGPAKSDKPEKKPSTTETKQFRKTTAKRKLAQASKRRNRG